MNPDEFKLEPGQETLLDLKLDELKRGLAAHAAPAAMEARSSRASARPGPPRRVRASGGCRPSRSPPPSP
jgi:hypothetical protein